ncbi:hypothetical protein CGCSCA5_v004242 [Colletotrichum siamense]|nr:hypothetical protein CGCSCA5_v004242 [Colletotrichum siamense]
MKHIGFLIVLCAVGSAAPASEQRQASTFYKIDDFYAGSGPKSSSTSYSFEVGIVTESGAMINQASCRSSSGDNYHSPSIPPAWTGWCTDGYYNFTFVSGRDHDSHGYYLNLTDSLGGRGTQFFPRSLVYRVQNNGNPDDPDPFPNYALRATNTSYAPRCMHSTGPP